MLFSQFIHVHKLNYKNFWVNKLGNFILQAKHMSDTCVHLYKSWTGLD